MAIPASVRVRIVFGGKATRFGLFWIGLFLWVVVIMRFYTEPQPTFDDMAQGTITSVDEVEAGSRYKVHYEFEDGNGITPASWTSRSSSPPRSASCGSSGARRARSRA